jgi:hypothetical protein
MTMCAVTIFFLRKCLEFTYLRGSPGKGLQSLANGIFVADN